MKEQDIKEDIKKYEKSVTCVEKELMRCIKDINKWSQGLIDGTEESRGKRIRLMADQCSSMVGAVIFINDTNRLIELISANK